MTDIPMILAFKTTLAPCLISHRMPNQGTLEIRCGDTSVLSLLHTSRFSYEEFPLYKRLEESDQTVTSATVKRYLEL